MSKNSLCHFLLAKKRYMCGVGNVIQSCKLRSSLQGLPWMAHYVSFQNHNDSAVDITVFFFFLLKFPIVTSH